uniref:Axonemal inner arm dynein heavy chain 3 n=1 Tax=Marsilea vestita TaxID=59764 RepID=A0A126TKQ9_MARVE|nr:axonemal inner arm dynein heavy chain 3 [Marsilea vestita]
MDIDPPPDRTSRKRPATEPLRDEDDILDPSVMVPYVTKVGELPRKVAIERRKRLFASQGLVDLLAAEGVTEDFQLNKPCLPLPVFDNTDFESRPPHRWVDKNKPVPAEAAYAEPQQPCIWKECEVLDYCDDGSQYMIRWTDTGQTAWIPRLFLHFKAESPFTFAKRFAQACRLRDQTEALLKYYLYVDSMPKEDIKTLREEQEDRITKLTFMCKEYREKTLDLGKYIKEVNTEYARIMNQIVLEDCLRNQKGVAQTFTVQLDVECIEKVPPPVPSFGCIAIPKYSYEERCSEFHFWSCITRSEVILATVRLRAECNKVLKLNLLNTHYNKSLRLEDFEQMQAQSIEQTSMHLRDSWTSVLKNIIRSSFKDVGKGWFNLQETSLDAYDASKMKRFLRMVRYMMEDSVRFLVEDTLTRYCNFVERHCGNPKVTVVDVDSVDTVWPQNDHKIVKKPPLFALEIVNLENGLFDYNTPLKHFEDVVCKAFDNAVACTQAIQQLEPSVMEKLMWSGSPTIGSVNLVEEGMVNLKNRIQVAIRKATGIAHTYLEKFKVFESMLQVEASKYKTELENKKLPLKELLAEVHGHRSDQDNIEKRIPTTITFGPFIVTCKKVRGLLVQRKSQLSDIVVSLIAQVPRTMSEGISRRFEEKEQQLKIKTRTPEDVAAQREYIAKLPMAINELRTEIDLTEVWYEALDDLNYALSDGDFNQKWALRFWPSRIEKLVEKTEKILATDMERYQREMEEEQVQFLLTLENLETTVSAFSRYTDLNQSEFVASEARKIEEQLKLAESKARLFNSRENLFGAPPTDYNRLKKNIENFEPYSYLWITADDWKKSFAHWMNGSFITLDPEDVEKKVTSWYKGLFKVSRLLTQKDATACAENCEEIRKEVGAFKPYVPLIAALRQPGMRDRHWDQLTKELNMDMHLTEDFTLSKGLQMGLMDHLDAITNVADIASKEFAIENSLLKMEADWKDLEMQVMEYKETGTYIVKIDEQILQQLDDHIAMTQSISFSPFKKPFEDKITKWEQQLVLVSEIVDEWFALQRQWMYLEPIFSSSDIQTQLPIESKRFNTINVVWRKVLNQAHLTPNILTMCSSKKLLDQLRESNKMIDMVQKGLADYLETKRLAFARFFFLSNDELLQILSQAKNPLAVQPFLHKCFEAIHELDFRPDLEILAMNSAEHEKVPFATTMQPSGNVETWLNEVEKKMKESILTQIRLSLAAYKTSPRTEWVQLWPGQVVICGSSVYWTEQVESAISKNSLQDYFDNVQVVQLLALTDLVRKPLSKLARLTLGALIVIDVHARDVVQKLLDEKVKAVTDFEWVSQLRYYWEDEGIKVRMVQATLSYGYEYLGNTPRLVITPLTDRCYMTLMGALHLNLGGAPAGPAGTGKTETTKDLAKAIAKQCVVFNCSDGLDYIAMGKFFKGLASTGAWACFDEFNRIDLEVLSVIAQQILTIQLAIQQKLKRFIFEDTEISLDPSCSVFITMNPGYAGRSELPDNLKALFRPCAMMVPDYALIGEISLFSFGFHRAKPLARKMVTTFKLCSEQLSSQDHYDYGMRAVKSVIVAAGNLKRAYPDEDEDVLLLRGLRDVNVPKFLSQDLPLFAGIITDLFPGVQPPKISYDDLLKAIATVCSELNIQPVDAFTTKIIQLYETTLVRHGLMLVGPTGGGKTMCYRTLSMAMTILNNEGSTTYQKVKTVCLNPKSITMGQLYGDFDENTHEWTDGVLACYMRELAGDPSPDKKWLMFDGPVDAVWIENMNTVLDDNKKLCLVSGEIIQMSSTMTMMFEVEDLAVASPATVSRCGMVYMEPSARGVDVLFTSWIQRVIPSVRAHEEKLRVMFKELVVGSVRMVKKNLKQTVATTEDNLVLSLLSVMDSLLIPFQKDGGAPLNEEEEKKLAQVIEPLFVFSLIWSAGVTCDNDSRVKFDVYVRDAIVDLNLERPPPDNLDVFGFYFDQNALDWVEWMQTIPKYVCNPEKPFSELIVPTADSVRSKFLLQSLFEIGKHVLCVGETGTGKTLVVQDKLLNDMNQSYVPIFINFSARTSANQTQDLIDAKTEKRRKGVYGPPPTKKFIIFVDDLNMPQREKYFAQPPIEILRQWMDHKGWYERKPPCAFRTLVDIQFVACMGPPGGGRNPVTNRFLRHFNFLSFNEMADESLFLIFHTILNATLSAKFSEVVRECGKNIVAGTIEIYNSIRKELLPTPSKSHYTFNLRDLSKVIQGVLRADPGRTQALHSIVSLWLHEAMRIFQDRLINNEDRTWFSKTLSIQLEKQFNVQWSDVITHERLIFCDFLVPGAEPRIYEEVKDFQKLSQIVDQYLEDYNNVSSAPMKLVMFLDAIEHAARICRVIRLPLGNALLLGVGGSGRQSLTKLATFMEDFELFQIEVVKGYGNNEWRDDLKRMLLKAGVDDKEMTFLFSDTQIVMESFLEDINNILNSGEVPNIWKNEDLDLIANAMRPLLQAKGLPATKIALQTTFLKRVRQNLHVVICMSPIGDATRTRLRMFPSLVNCCTIDWFHEWPEEALRSVATNFIAATQLLEPDQVQSVVEVCVFIHQSVEAASKEFYDETRRHVYITPTSYLELLQTYIKLLDEKREELGQLRGRLSAGLNKLETTAKDVEVMQKELVLLQPVLEKTVKEANDMMLTISEDKKNADITKQEVAKQEAEANIQAAESKAIADSAQRDVDQAMPALENALSSLKNLTKADIVEVKSLKNPPEGVKMVMEATCIMFQVAPKMVPDPNKLGKKIPDYWEPSTKLLTDPQKFLDSLLQFDKDNITAATIEKIEPYIQSEAFTPEQVARVSKACTSICMWARAMHAYYLVCLVVAPKRAQLAIAQAQLDATMQLLNNAQLKLKEVEKKIQRLEAELDAAVRKKDELEKKASDCQKRLDRAGKLIGGLGGERARWGETIRMLTTNITHVVGDVAVAAGSIAYAGPFTPNYRKKLNTEWLNKLKDKKVPHTPDVDLQLVLKDPVKMRSWNIAGLPSDSLSEDNGIIVFKARRWSLMIDPQGQANKWIKNMYKETGLDVIKLSEKDYLRTLENAVRFGRIVLLENVMETLDPALEPLLLQQKIKQGGQEVIKIGDNIIPYHPDFRMFITTKLSNPHYPPEVSVKVTLLNFFVTQEGLEEQLLGQVVTKERPDLAEMKNHLTISNANMKRELKEIESKILHLLSKSQGDILDDEVLINTLSQSKVTSDEITIKVAEAEKTEIAIDETREVYRKVATRASQLFFCISDLATVDPMYQYSLTWFISLFNRAMEGATQASIIEKRIENLNEYFTYSLYVNVCRSLFEKHKLMFSLMLCIKILQELKAINSAEWRFLLAGATSSTMTSPNPASDWLTNKSWVEILNLCKLEKFKGFEQHFILNIAHYKRIFDSSEAHQEPLPEDWNNRLNKLQKLLILRCLRVDKALLGIQDFVADYLGQRFIEPPAFDLSACYKDGSPSSPLIFVLSSGADPMADLLKLAEDLRFTKKFEKVSLGQGQGPKAERLLELGMERGMWVCLQNCHLSQSWMPHLERIVENIDPEKVHKDFRLWLTSMPSPDFPVSILQNGVKMTLEPPKGLKSNLLRSYLRFTDKVLNDCVKPDPWKKMLFATCLFHAVIQERRKFGALGWNIRYEFTDGDLSVCQTQIRMFLNEYEEIPYKVIRFLCGEINYGGRVTDDKDRRLMNNLLHKFIIPEVIVSTKYSFSESGVYYVPDATNVNTFVQYVKELPLVPKPEIFGLHENADITCDQNESYDVFRTLLSLQPRERAAGAGSLTREQIIEKSCQEILSKLPRVFDVEAVLQKYPTMYTESMNTVLTQECIRYNGLLRVMKISLQETLKALKGLVMMSSDLEMLCNSIFNNQVPDLWAGKAYPSLKPLSSWVVDLLQRTDFIQKWIDQGAPPVFWISGFFFPQAFLTGTLQNFARKYKYPIDTVGFNFIIRDDVTVQTVKNPPEDGCFIRGLFLEGSRWDYQKHMLTESRPKELYSELPIVWLKPVQFRKAPESGIYECPVYKTLLRAGTLSTTGHSTNFVMYIELPTDKPQAHWINRGVGLFTSLAY